MPCASRSAASHVSLLLDLKDVSLHKVGVLKVVAHDDVIGPICHQLVTLKLHGPDCTQGIAKS